MDVVKTAKVVLADTANRAAVDEFLLRLAKKFMKNNPVFQNATSDEEILKVYRELDNWNPPEYLEKNFPYYFSGNSFNGEPIWISESGKYNVRELANQSKEILDAVDKAFVQALARGVYSMANGGEMKRVRAIVDFEGLSFSQVSSPAALALIIKFCYRYGDVASEMLDEAIIINANTVVEMLIKRVRPILSKLLKKVTVYGKNKDKWTAQIQKAFPSSSIPELYGGSLRLQCV